MRARRILILYEPGLLAQGLRSLLEADGRLEIISIVGDPRQAADLLREINPDALVVEGDKFPLGLGDPPQPIQLDRVPLVISLAENENRMRIYHMEERASTELKELIEALVANNDGPER